MVYTEAGPTRVQSRGFIRLILQASLDILLAGCYDESIKTELFSVFALPCFQNRHEKGMR